MRLYLKLNDTGSGDVTYPLDRAEASAITIGSWVDMKYRGTSLGGFWCERIELVTINQSERSGRVLHATGRGALAILDDAIVADWGTPGMEMTRYFNTEDGGDNFTDPMNKKGWILHRLIHEALEIQTNPALQTMERFCWHDSSGNHLLAHAFSNTVDSDSIAWDVAEDVSLEAGVGTSLFDIVRQYSALGQPTAGLVFDIEASYNTSTGITTFGIHQTPIGISAANAVIHFRVGHNCTSVSDVTDMADLRNSGLVAYNGTSSPDTDIPDDTVSIAAYRRRECLLNAANASSDTDAAAYGAVLISALAYPKRSVTMRVTDAATIKYGSHYNLGDHVYYDDGTGVETTFRIWGIQLEWDDSTLNATLELRNYADGY